MLYRSTSGWLTVLCLMISFQLAACRKVIEAPSPPTGSALVEAFKADLTSIATHGEGGSALDEFRSHFELLQQEDPAKADAIQKDFKALMSATTPEKRKELAQKIQSEF